MRRSFRIALACLTVLVAACATSRPAQTLAGSTPVLQLLRDWRGVWKGTVKDSPMGAMAYVLWVAAAGGSLTAQMAPQQESGLESMQHSYEFIDFDRGHPSIRFRLQQRNSLQADEVFYRDDLSTDDAAVFCHPDAGCDKVRLTITRVSDRRLVFAATVDEAAHCEISLAYAGAEIPQQLAEDTAASTLKRTRIPGKVESKDPTEDRDVYLEENFDKDVVEGQ